MTLPLSNNPGEPVGESGRVKVILLGYGHLGIALLRGLLASAECEIVGVFRWSGRPASQSYWDAIEKDFADLIRNHGLREIRCAGVNSYEFVRLTRQLKADTLLIGSWGEILKPHILALPDLTILNCHPSPLPAHRGANPYASVILAGEAETGVTFHQVTPRIDAGPVLLQERLAVRLDETGGSLRDRCAELAERMTPTVMKLLFRHLREGESMPWQPQTEDEHSYYPQLKIEDGLVDWTQSPEALSARLRALNPWIACYSFLEGRLLVLLQVAKLVEAKHEARGCHAGMIVAQADGAFYVATSDPVRWLEVPACRICFGPGYLPVRFSRWLGRWLFRPGRRFGSQT